MNEQAAVRLAAWIAKTNPALFDALAQEAGAKLAPGGMAGFFDTLKTIGSTVGGAVKSVGSFLTSQEGLKTLTEIGGAYMVTREQRTMLQLQVEQAQAGAPPLPISTQVDPASGLPRPMYRAPDGSVYPLTADLASQLRAAAQPAQYWPWFLIGSGALLLLLLLRRR